MRVGWLRGVTFGLVAVHAFPAAKHLPLFVAERSLAEAWKGIGAVLAMAIYVLPIDVQARALGTLWRTHRRALSLATIALAVAHLVPTLDHVPRFVACPTWADGWRGAGAAVAAAWFALPLPIQATVLARLRFFLRREVRVGLS